MKRNKRWVRWAILVGILAVILGCCLFPLPVACGAPGRVCRTGPLPGGVSRIHYELEPLGVVLVELVTGEDLPLYYWRWESSE